MAEALNGLKRTILSGNVTEANLAERITVMGWVQRKRNLGALIFVDLRDKSGVLQVVFGEAINKEAFEKADSVRSEYCIAVT